MAVTPKLHALFWHAPDDLELIGSLEQYSEQGVEASHGHFNQNALHYKLTAFFRAAWNMSGGRLSVALRATRPTTVASGGHRGPPMRVGALPVVPATNVEPLGER